MTNLGRLGISRFLRAALCFTGACLIVMQAAQAQTYTIVHSFAGPPNDGAFANGELIQDAAGNFYGTTFEGGPGNAGTVFKLDPSGTVTLIANFDVSQSSNPDGGLLRDLAGNFYGASASGTGSGTIYKLDTSGTVKTLHVYGFGQDGAGPQSRLVTISGDLYGVTEGGGSGSFSNCTGGCGTIFKMTKGGTETILYNFTGGADGAHPQGLIRDSAGNLYGVAISSSPGAGTAWKLDTAGVFSVLYTFTGGADGGQPMGRLIRDNTKGTLRGVASSGGDPTCNCGVVFSLDTSGNERVIHKFFGRGGGARPFVGLLNVGGVLYGTTVFGGDLTCNSGGGCGVLYRISKTGQYTVLHRFAGSAGGDGAYNSVGGLALGADGSIYGATWYGGTATACAGSLPGCGVIFKYAP